MPIRVMLETPAKVGRFRPSVGTGVTRIEVETLVCAPAAVAVNEILFEPYCSVVGVQTNVLLTLVALVRGRVGINVPPAGTWLADKPTGTLAPALAVTSNATGSPAITLNGPGGDNTRVGAPFMLRVLNQISDSAEGFRGFIAGIISNLGSRSNAGRGMKLSSSPSASQGYRSSAETPQEFSGFSITRLNLQRAARGDAGVVTAAQTRQNCGSSIRYLCGM